MCNIRQNELELIYNVTQETWCGNGREKRDDDNVGRENKNPNQSWENRIVEWAK